MTELPGVFLFSFLFSVSQICSSQFFSDMPLARASTHAPHVYEEKFAFQSLTYKGFEIGVFSDWNSRALGRPAAQSSGVEKTLSSVIFTLPKHAGALQCVDIRGCLCSGTNIRSEKYCIGNIFHSFVLRTEVFFSAGASASAAAAASASF